MTEQQTITVTQDGSLLDLLSFVTAHELFLACFFLGLSMLAVENIKALLRARGLMRGDAGPRILAMSICGGVTLASYPAGVVDPLYAAIFLGSLAPLLYRPVKARLRRRFPSAFPIKRRKDD